MELLKAVHVPLSETRQLKETVRTDSSNLRFCQSDASSVPFSSLSRLKNRLQLEYSVLTLSLGLIVR